jgi:chromosome segregation ATPase
MEGMWREEKEKRQGLEDELAKAREEHEDKVRDLQFDLDELRGQVDDQLEEMSRLRDTADIAQDELERVREEARGLTESVGLGKGRESRTIAKLEAEIAELKADLETAQKGQDGDIEALEDRINEWRDKHDAAQIELERRDQEIEELNNEIDTKIAEHERELNAVENEWRDELLVARSQADELKDVMAEREQELDDFRKLILDREDELMVARDRVAELEAAQGETAERLHETLRGIEMDNATKEEDIIAANHEVDRVSCGA